MKFEIEIIKWLQENRNGFTDFLFEFFTFFGEIPIIIGILIYVYWSINKESAKRLALVIFLAAGLNRFVKLLISRPRPYLVDSNIENLRPGTSGGTSMPSGHTQSASTTFFGLYYAFKKKYLLIAAIIITVLVAISRLYLGVHYLTDTIAGGILGFLLVYALNYLLDKVKNIDFWLRVLGIIATIAFFSLVAYQMIHLSNGVVFNGNVFYSELKSISEILGVLIGFVIAIEFEKKFVNFSNHSILSKNLIRFILGIIIILGINFGLKELLKLIINPENLRTHIIKSLVAVLFDFFRYLIVVVLAIGAYPVLFKKLSI